MFRRSFLLWTLPVPVQRRADNFPHYELCVIGSGPGGVAGAMRAASLGRKVCIVEAKRLGGRDIWNGTLQSKTLWEMGKFVAKATTQSGYVDGILDPSVVPQIKAAVDRDRIRRSLQHISEQREATIQNMILRTGIDIIAGTATFSNAHEIDIKSCETGEYRGLSADYFLIATGSAPAEHPLCPSDHKRVVTSDDVFSQPIPKSLVIIGAGPMGCEFASMYASLGLSKVYLVDHAPRILPREDDDVASSVQESLTRLGVTVHHECHLFELTAFDDGEVGGVQYSLQNKKSGCIETNLVDMALVTVGRRPYYRGLGLENTKMRLSNGHLVVDEYNRCQPYRHIYCVGDAGNDLKLVNVAQAMARAAVQHMYGLTPPVVVSSKSINNFSTNMFLDEEVACVGLSERQCQEQQIGYFVSKYSNSFLARAQVSGETNGFVKLIVTNDRQKRVLGVRAVGPHAASIVETVSLAIRNKQSVYDLLRLNAPYPSMVLSVVECARMLVGRGSWNSWSKPGDDPNTSATSIREWRPDGYERGRAYQAESESQRSRKTGRFD